MTTLLIDLETRSACDLLKCGSRVYAEHPSTQIVHFGYKVNDQPGKIWWCLRDPLPFELGVLLSDPEVKLEAHNSAFEADLLRFSDHAQELLGPAIIEAISDWNRWDCTAARAAAVGLPRALGDVAKVLKLKHQKDHAGHALMLQMCKPRKYSRKELREWEALHPGTTPPIRWWEDDARMQRQAVYCLGDLDAEYELGHCGFVPHLSAFERQVWILTNEMNDRGIEVDVPLCTAMAALVRDADERLGAQMAASTGGAVPSVKDHGALTRWLGEQGLPEDLWAEGNGVGKSIVAGLIDNPDVDPLLRAVLILRRDGAKSSAAKYLSILRRTAKDGRLHGALVYCGAAATGRWASVGAQLQNLPRGGSVKRISDAIRDVLDGCGMDWIEEFYAPLMVVATEAIRPVFKAAEGKWLARGDYSQIEARMTAWLAGAEWKLDVFRRYDAGTGPDVYRVTAAGVSGNLVEDVTAKERQEQGKVPELACGFQGGKGAFAAMGKTMGVHVDPERAQQIVDGWRAKNVEIVELWYAAERAARACMTGSTGVRYYVHQHVRERRPVGDEWVDNHIRLPDRGLYFARNKTNLVSGLPSGRKIVYWSPAYEMRLKPWGEEAMTVTFWAWDGKYKRWAKFDGYGGMWVQNIAQAAARDVAAASMIECSRRGLPPVLLVHDELITEVDKSRAADVDGAATLVREGMLHAEPWMIGLPVAVDASAGARYVKA